MKPSGKLGMLRPACMDGHIFGSNVNALKLYALELEKALEERKDIPPEVWEQRRFEVAKAVIPALITHNSSEWADPRRVAGWAVEYANALLAELDGGSK